MFFDGQRGADLLVTFALRLEPDGQWTVQRQVIDWSQLLVGNPPALSEEQQAAIMHNMSAQPIEQPNPVGGGANFMQDAEKVIEFGARVGPNIKSIVDLFRGKPPKEST